jgi:protein-L-isoaspartate(D-aspartate) O-methyltransferase
LLTAAPHAVPAALFDQLAIGGRLIAPVGPDGRQELFCYTKLEAKGQTRIEQRSLGAVSFVPLLSGLMR